jgi:hypothetical protein
MVGSSPVEVGGKWLPQPHTSNQVDVRRPGAAGHQYGGVTIDALAKSLEIVFSVIQAEAGIQQAQAGSNHLDSGLRRSDDVLRCHPG